MKKIDVKECSCDTGMLRIDNCMVENWEGDGRYEVVFFETDNDNDFNDFRINNKNVIAVDCRHNEQSLVYSNDCDKNQGFLFELKNSYFLVGWNDEKLQYEILNMK
ncbi:MAG: hypothetical protein LBF97_02825 [Elusimicrobiota bacterium]|jgi:hypothetical protein|nr:hypothetical protein [Elusimicrobiota bacterium]